MITKTRLFPILLLVALCAGCLFLTPQPAFGSIAETEAVTAADEATQQQPEQTVSSSAFIRFIQHNLTDLTFLHKLHFLLYLIAPLAILAFSLVMFLRKNWKNPRLLFALSLSEFLFAFGNASVGTSSFPWFCDYTIVGWIVTILCFLYLLRLLVTQITILRATIAGLSDRRPIRIGLLLFYIAIAVSFTFFFSGKGLYWMAPVVVAAMWYFTRKNLTDSPAETWRFIGYTGVVFGGLIIFFLASAIVCSTDIRRCDSHIADKPDSLLTLKQ